MKNILLIICVIFLSAFINNSNVTETRTKVEDALKQVINERGISGKLKIKVNGYYNGFDIKGNADKYNVYISDLQITPGARFFKAIASFIREDNHTYDFKINGTYDQLIRVPALAHKMSRNSVITESDLTWIELSRKYVEFDTITETSDLIGKALKRNMHAAKKIRKRDVVKQQIMSKNTTVDIVFRTPSILIRTVGISLENGGMGDLIKVRNSKSNKIIRAVIQGENTVEAISQHSNIL